MFQDEILTILFTSQVCYSELKLIPKHSLWPKGTLSIQALISTLN